MKINVNLASRPYEDVRSFFMKWVPLLAALAVITIALSVKAYLAYRDSRQVENQIADRRQQIDKLQQEQLAAQSLLNQPENSGTRDQAQFLNSLFARKAFSWTQVMADLERIMPAQVQVVSIRPQLDADGGLQFTLDVTTNRRDSAIELVRRMETSPRFAEPQIKSESSREESFSNDSPEKKVRVEIIALYIPDAARSNAETRAESR
jgi:type IV pilus assembly protein PilN